LATNFAERQGCAATKRQEREIAMDKKPEAEPAVAEAVEDSKKNKVCF
jgi:hypothetical protein